MNKKENVSKSKNSAVEKTTENTSLSIPENLEPFFNLAAELLFILNKKLNIIKVNKTFAEKLGYAETWSINKNILDIIDTEFVDKVNNNFNMAAEGVKTEGILIKLKTKNKNKLNVLLKLIFENGCFFCSAADVTNQIELEEQLHQTKEKFQLVLDHIPMSVCWKDSNANYMGCNKLFAKAAGIDDPEKIIGKDDTKLPWNDLAEERNKTNFLLMETDNAIINNEEKLIVEDKEYWLRVNKIPLHDRLNNVIGVLSTYEDITKIKKEENALRQSELRFRMLFENSIDALGVMSQSGHHLYVNEAYRKLYGYEKLEDIIGRPILDFVAEEKREFVKSILDKRSKNENAPSVYESMGLRKDGTTFIINIHATVYEVDSVQHTLVIIRDITERKNLERKLKESELKYRTIAENTYDWEYWTIPEVKFVYVSPSCKRITGYDASEFLENYHLINKIVHPDDIEKFTTHQRKANEERVGAYIQFRIKNANGSTVWIDHVCMPVYDDDKNFLGIRGSNRDITERKLMEERVRDREATLSALFDSITEFAILIDTKGIIKTANETAAKLFNCTASEMAGKNILDLMPNNIAIDHNKYLDEVMRTKKPARFEDEVEGIINDITIYPVIEKGEDVSAFVIIRVDITQKREAIEAIFDRDAMLTALINATTESAFLIDTNGKILIANDTVAKRFGTTIDVFVGQSLYDLVETEVAAERKSYMEKVIDTGVPMRFEDKRRDLIIDNSVYPVFNEKGKVIRLAIFGSDITKRKMAEEEINKMNKTLLELNSTKDKFFSIIAHDLRSPFQGLLGYSQILTEDYQELSEEERKQYIINIAEISHNSYKLLENLLQWSRMQTGNFEFNPEVINLSEELIPTIELLKQTALNKDITVASLLKPKVYVMADKNMLNTVVRNLVSNAIKFTNTGGNIIISSKELDNYIVVSVKDDGVGMNKEKLNNLFKVVKNISTLGTAKEKGTGLGLLLCKEMVEKHSGEIWVESAEGHGSTFYFTLPKRI